jgi:hypothetical protein
VKAKSKTKSDGRGTDVDGRAKASDGDETVTERKKRVHGRDVASGRGGAGGAGGGARPNLREPKPATGANRYTYLPSVPSPSSSDEDHEDHEVDVDADDASSTGSGGDDRDVVLTDPSDWELEGAEDGAGELSYDNRSENEERTRTIGDRRKRDDDESSPPPTSSATGTRSGAAAAASSWLFGVFRASRQGKRRSSESAREVEPILKHWRRHRAATSGRVAATANYGGRAARPGSAGEGDDDDLHLAEQGDGHENADGGGDGLTIQPTFEHCLKARSSRWLTVTVLAGTLSAACAVVFAVVLHRAVIFGGEASLSSFDVDVHGGGVGVDGHSDGFMEAAGPGIAPVPQDSVPSLLAVRRRSHGGGAKAKARAEAESGADKGRKGGANLRSSSGRSSAVTTVAAVGKTKDAGNPSSFSRAATMSDEAPLAQPLAKSTRVHESRRKRATAVGAKGAGTTGSSDQATGSLARGGLSRRPGGGGGEAPMSPKEAMDTLINLPLLGDTSPLPSAAAANDTTTTAGPDAASVNTDAAANVVGTSAAVLSAGAAHGASASSAGETRVPSEGGSTSTLTAMTPTPTNAASSINAKYLIGLTTSAGFGDQFQRIATYAAMARDLNRTLVLWPLFTSPHYRLDGGQGPLKFSDYVQVNAAS